MRPPGLGPPSHSPSHWQSLEGAATLMRLQQVQLVASQPPSSAQPVTANSCRTGRLSTSVAGRRRRPAPTTKPSKNVTLRQIRTFLIQLDDSVGLCLMAGAAITSLLGFIRGLNEKSCIGSSFSIWLRVSFMN